MNGARALSNMYKYLFLLNIFCVWAAGSAAAQPYPNKPIRFIVPVPAGGGADFVARAYASRLGEALEIGRAHV